MLRVAAAFALLCSSAALATGERITLTGGATQLQEALCISMTCVSDGAKEFVVSGRPVSGGIELTVTSSAGQRRLTHVAKVSESNRISSIDLVRAASLVVRSIESGPVTSPDAPKVAAAKKPRSRSLLARR
jgi:hypothetical protein